MTKVPKFDTKMVDALAAAETGEVIINQSVGLKTTEHPVSLGEIQKPDSTPKENPVLKRRREI
mgnify:FL=1